MPFVACFTELVAARSHYLVDTVLVCVMAHLVRTVIKVIVERMLMLTESLDSPRAHQSGQNLHCAMETGVHRVCLISFDYFRNFFGLLSFVNRKVSIDSRVPSLYLSDLKSAKAHHEDKETKEHNPDQHASELHLSHVVRLSKLVAFSASLHYV